MKSARMMVTILEVVGMMALAASPGWAVDTTVTYSSGILVLAFLGVLALIVVAQLVPALVLMIGFFKAVITAMTRRKAAVPAENAAPKAP